MRLGAARFVAGETLDECIAVLRRLNEQGLYANTTLLGEGVLEPGETERVVAAYEEVLDRIAAEELRANVALKLTHLGLEIDEELAVANMTRLLGEGSVHPHRHGAVAVRRRDSPHLPPPPRTTASTMSAPSCRRTSTARPTIWTRCSRSRRTSGSSRARTSSRRTSPIRARPTSTRSTPASRSACSRARATSRSRPTTRR